MPDNPRDPFEPFTLMLDRAREQSSPFAGRKTRALELVSRLSAEEKLVLGRIVAGWSNADIAADHHLDVGGFAKMRAEIFTKISARTTSDAVRIGIYAGL